MTGHGGIFALLYCFKSKKNLDLPAITKAHKSCCNAFAGPVFSSSKNKLELKLGNDIKIGNVKEY